MTGDAFHAFRDEHRECTQIALHDLGDDGISHMLKAYSGLTEVGWATGPGRGARRRGWTVYRNGVRGDKLTVPARGTAEAVLRMVANAYVDGRSW